MDFGLPVAMRFYLWPFWHQFSLLIYLLVSIVFTIAAMKKANAMRRRRKVFAKLEVSMLRDRQDSSKNMSTEEMLNYEEVLQRQLAEQGLKLEKKPVISKLIMWQAIVVMIIMNILSITFGIIQSGSELKQKLAPEQKQAAQQQYGVEFDEDTDIEVPFIDYLGKVWKSSHIQNVWVFDIIFVLIILITAASEKEYWREAWRLIKLRKIGITAFYIFMIYILIAVLDSISWRDVKLDDFGNAELKQTGKTTAVRDSSGNIIKPSEKIDIDRLPVYKQNMIGDPILENEQRSLLDRLFSFWSDSKNDEQGYSSPFARYTLNKTKLNDFRTNLYFDIPVNSGDVEFKLNEIDSNHKVDVDLFLRWEQPVVLNHSYKPIDGKYVKPPWERTDLSSKYYKPKNDDASLARWWDELYTNTLECDLKSDSSESFSSFVLTQDKIKEYINTHMKDGETDKKYVRLYVCMAAWNKNTGQPAIIDENSVAGKSDYGLESVKFNGSLVVSFVNDTKIQFNAERDKTGSIHLYSGRAANISYPNVTREYRPLKQMHILGTSKVGKDTLYESMKGVRTGIIIGVVTTLIAIPFSLLFGIIAGYFGGWVDDVIVYFYSVLGNIPSILLIAAFVMLFGQGIFQLCLIMGITSWVGLCRLLRGETYKLREMEYVQAAEAFGVPKYKIIMRHLMPNVLHIVMISAILRFSGLVMSEVMLTYLQIGVGKSSWGKMIVISRQELARDPAVWWPMAAAFILMLVLILSANLFGDAVQDALDPRLRTK